MDLSIIIVNYNGGDLLTNCLMSIYKNTKDIEFEVVIVDNNSNDNSVGMLREEFKEVNLIENKHNVGFTKANNQGIKKSKGRYVLLLNWDTVVNLETFPIMIKFMNAHRDIGIIGPKMLNPDDTIQMSCRNFLSLKTVFFTRDSLFTKLFPNNRFSRRYLLSDWDHNETREVGWVSGACMMIRKELLEDIGLFDEDFFIYCEDVDFCYRAKKRGWKIFYVPDASIIHYSGRGTQALKYIIIHHKSMIIFYKKHFHRNLFLDIVVLNGIILRLSTCILKAILFKK